MSDRRKERYEPQGMAGLYEEVIECHKRMDANGNPEYRIKYTDGGTQTLKGADAYEFDEFRLPRTCYRSFSSNGKEFDKAIEKTEDIER